MAPPWSNKVFKGPIFTSMSQLFTPDQLSELNEDQIFETVAGNLNFDAGAYNAEHRYVYKVNDIANLENLIYQCPKCGHEGLHSAKHKLVCPNCGRELVYDQYGLLDGQSLFAHYERQRIALETKISEDKDYSIGTDVRLVRFVGNRLSETGRGYITLNRDEYVYVGTDKGQAVTYRFDTKNIQYLPVDIGGDIQIYEKYEVYQFYMDTKFLPIKFSTVGEYFYRLKNNKV